MCVSVHLPDCALVYMEDKAGAAQDKKGACVQQGTRLQQAAHNIAV